MKIIVYPNTKLYVMESVQSSVMVPGNELQALLKEAKEKAEATEQKRLHEKFNTWMKQITAA